MKIKNRDNIVHGVNLATSPPTSLHLSPGEISKPLKKEVVETSAEVLNMLKKKKFVVVEEVKDETSSKPKIESKKGKGGKG